MNSVDRVLYEELTHLMDRLATSVPDGSLSAAGHPLLRTRLDEADAQLAAARASLLEDYGRWRRAAAAGPSLHEGLQADVIDGLFEALAHLELDTRAETVGAIGVAEGHDAQPSIARRPVARGIGLCPNVV